MSGQSHIPSNSEKKFGYFFVALKELINGFDNGSGFTKIPIWIAGLSVTAIFAPYVLAGGGLFAGLYLVRAVYEEYQTHKRQQEKMREKSQLAVDYAILQQQLLSVITENLAREEDVQMFLLSQRLAGKKEEEIQATFNEKMEQKFSKRYNALFNPAASKEANEALLKCLLRDYFDALDKKIDRTHNDRLPSQNKILKQIHKVTGLNPYHANFHEEMHTFLTGDVNLQYQFQAAFPEHQYEQQTGWIGRIKNKINAFAAFIKQQRKARRIGRKIFDFVADFGTGAGITTALLTMFSVIVVGLPVTWPLVVAIVASGVLYGVISFTYQIISGDKNRRHLKSLDKEINQQEIKIELTKRLLKIQKDPNKLQEKHYKFYKANQEDSLFNLKPEEDIEQLSFLPKKKKLLTRKIPAKVYARMAFSILSQVIIGVALGLIVSLGIIWVGTVLFPALPLLVPTLGLGGAITLGYIYRGLKSDIKSISREFDSYQEVAVMKERLLNKYSENPQVAKDLAKTNQMLLSETIENYLAFIRNLGGADARHKNGKYPQQEKIFTLIEDLMGKKRGRDATGALLLTGNDKFYNEIALYLQVSGKNLQEANGLIGEFKQLFYQPDINPHITQSLVNAEDPTILKEESGLKKVGMFLRDNALNLVGMAAVGVMVPLFLLGPQIIVLAIAAAIVVTACVTTQLAARKSQQNIAQLNQEALKCSLIERKQKLISCNNYFNFGNEHVMAQDEVPYLSSFEKNHQDTLTELSKKNLKTKLVSEFKPEEKNRQPKLSSVRRWAELDHEFVHNSQNRQGIEKTVCEISVKA